MLDEMIVQMVVSGLARGSVYSLIALGFYITYKTTKTLNFAQGEALMMGAMIGYSSYVVFGMNYIVSIIIALIVMGAMGALIERVAVRPLRSLATHGYILSTVGAGMVLKNIAVLTWGGGEHYIPSVFGEEVIKVAGAGILPQELANFFISMVTMVLVLVLLQKSLLGKGLRAVALNKDAAGLMGINVKKLIVFSYVLSTALAALAGILISPVTYASPAMGIIGLKAFGVAIIGGIGNPIGIVLAGLLLGVSEFLFGILGASWREASAFIMIMLILAVRPDGLFSRAVSEKV